MSKDSEYWEYWKKRMIEEENQKLKNEVTRLKREIEVLEDLNEYLEHEEE